MWAMGVIVTASYTITRKASRVVHNVRFRGIRIDNLVILVFVGLVIVCRYVGAEEGV